MEISEKLLKFRFHLIVAVVLSLLLSGLFILAPSFLTIIAYFWPLLLSTALFLAAVLVFARASPHASESTGDKAGEGLLDYVAGQPDPQSEQPGAEPELKPEPEPRSAGESLKTE